MPTKILVYALNWNQRMHLNELLYSAGLSVQHTDSLREAYDLVSGEHGFKLVVAAAAPAYAETLVRKAQLPAVVIGRELCSLHQIDCPVIHLPDDEDDCVIIRKVSELLGDGSAQSDE